MTSGAGSRTSSHSRHLAARSGCKGWGCMSAPRSMKEAFEAAERIGVGSSALKIGQILRILGNGAICTRLLTPSGLAPLQAWMKAGVPFIDIEHVIAVRCTLGLSPGAIYSWQYFVGMMCERFPELDHLVRKSEDHP